MFSRKAGSLVVTHFTTPRNHPAQMRVNAAFVDLVQQAVKQCAVRKWEDLPPQALRELEMLLALLIEQAESAFATSYGGPDASYVKQLQDAARSQESLGARASRAFRIAVAENVAFQGSCLELGDQSLVEWMGVNGPGVWHEVAMGYNWDADAARDLGWIIDQPACDLATALLVFVRGCPDDVVCRKSFDGLPTYQQDVCRLIDRIAVRVVANGYPTRRFGICEGEADNWCFLNDNYRAQGRYMRWFVPNSVFSSLQNEPTDSPYVFHDGEIHVRPVN